MSVLALKIDVDTYQGMKTGIPHIVKVLDKYGIPASFFISFGPDRSGLAALQLLRPKFLYKMIRTNAPGMYGIKTALYGTILPAPMIGLSFPEDIKHLSEMGHEVACHAWDHRLWQDWLPLMSRNRIDIWLDRLVNAYMETLCERPQGFGAPGWRMDKRALEIINRFGFKYLSCTRASMPFIFRENGMIEIPSNLPCIEEVGTKGVIRVLEDNADSPGPQVLPVHAEVEGGLYENDFKQILDKAMSLGYNIERIDNIVKDIDRKGLHMRGLQQGFIPGRAFKCSV
ncbi:MAG: polysaccharide deacetylase family protein [Deltaproteobacteria bacterium]|nr:polysaccharide deacetylase family protein [Deltaproteobacteria bacterium]